MIKVTLLAAGFVIGAGGSSIRSIAHRTGADIKSWTEKGNHRREDSGLLEDNIPRPVRIFIISGVQNSRKEALGIICSAIDRYKASRAHHHCPPTAPLAMTRDYARTTNMTLHT